MTILTIYKYIMKVIFNLIIPKLIVKKPFLQVKYNLTKGDYSSSFGINDRSLISNNENFFYFHEE
jgi:hypothetical protein